jgi:nucleotide-binding universal stress UspA family protein
MFRKILVPIDGSKHSMMAAAHAVDIAEKYHAAVTLLHVINISQLTGLDIMQGPPLITEGMSDKLNEAGQAIIAETLKSLPPHGVTINTELVWGSPEAVIISRVKSEPYDLVVIGSRGLSALSGLLLGSVSSRVVHRAPCPVMLVK